MRLVPAYPLVLASRSPRRRYLLSLLDIDFSVVEPVGVKEQEHLLDHQSPPDLAIYNATAKALSVSSQQRDALVVSADTLVWVDNRLLPKPVSPSKAAEFLSILSGRTHMVYTGVCVALNSKPVIQFCEGAEVEFWFLSAEQIDYYVNHYMPLDKAGAYGAQDWIGVTAIRAVRGDFYTVVGLPVARLFRELMERGLIRFA